MMGFYQSPGFKGSFSETDEKYQSKTPEIVIDKDL